MSRKIVFMGTPLFAVPVLKSLYQNGYPISAVFTQPEKKSKRGMGFNRTPVHSLSEILNLECRTPLSLKNNKKEYIIRGANSYLNKELLPKKYNNSDWKIKDIDSEGKLRIFKGDCYKSLLFSEY